MNYIFYIILTLAIFLNSCSSVRESAGVTRKSFDEYVVVENPPLIIPPDFDLIPPDQLEEIDDVAVTVEKTDGQKCERCWKYTDILQDKQICQRCDEAIKK